MKEKTKAFYKTVFKYWLKESVAPFIAALKRYFKESEGLHEQKAKKKAI